MLQAPPLAHVCPQTISECTTRSDGGVVLVFVQIGKSIWEIDDPVRLSNEPVRIGGPVRLSNEPVRISGPVRLSNEPVRIGGPVRLSNEPVRIGGPVRLSNEPVRVDDPVRLSNEPVRVVKNLFSIRAACNWNLLLPCICLLNVGSPEVFYHLWS